MAGRLTLLGLAPPGTPVSLCAVGTNTLVATYTNQAGSGLAAANPVILDPLGNLNTFVPAGDVDVVWSAGFDTVRVTFSVREDPNFTTGHA